MTEVSLAQNPVNLDTWMRDLPEQLKDVPLIYLAIPGTHDSMTYGITRSSGLAPDAEPEWSKLFPLFRGTIMRWTITQSLDATGQLHLGIRYLDLRLATKSGTEDLFFTHGLYAAEISQGLMDVKNFVDSHPGEVVILDFQHFYGFTAADHQRLLRFLLNLYGARLVPRTMELTSVTLNSVNRLRQSVIVVYRHEAVYSTYEFWQPQMMPSPWPRQETTAGLNTFFEHVNRSPGSGFVHQAVLTPTAKFIVFRWISSVKEKCAKPVLHDVLPKLAEFSPGPPKRTEPPTRSPVNVVIADFIELNNAVFPTTIIQLNFKLLRKSDVNQDHIGEVWMSEERRPKTRGWIDLLKSFLLSMRRNVSCHRSLQS